MAVASGAINFIGKAWSKDVPQSIDDKLKEDNAQSVDKVAYAAIEVAALKVAFYGAAAAGVYLTGAAIGDGIPWVLNQLVHAADSLPALYQTHQFLGGWYVANGFGLVDAVGGTQQLVTGNSTLGQSMGRIMTYPVGIAFAGRELAVPFAREVISPVARAIGDMFRDYGHAK